VCSHGSEQITCYNRSLAAPNTLCQPKVGGVCRTCMILNKPAICYPDGTRRKEQFLCGRPGGAHQGSWREGFRNYVRASQQLTLEGAYNNPQATQWQGKETVPPNDLINSLYNGRIVIIFQLNLESRRVCHRPSRIHITTVIQVNDEAKCTAFYLTKPN
jgi:hypothetical protein